MEKNKIIKRSIACTGLHVRETEGEERSRTIAGYAIVFNTESAVLWADGNEEVREVIAPEAVTLDLLNASDIKFTMYHDRQVLLGRSNMGKGTLKYSIDDHGVMFELDLPDSPNGDEALALVERGDIDGCSFAFTTYYFDDEYVECKSKMVDDVKRTVYTVKKMLGIYDFTITPDPAYPATEVDLRDLRSAIEGRKPAKVDNAEQLRAMRLVAAQNIFSN